MAENTKTKKDTFRERFSKRYPDLNMEDEDAYYDQAGSMMDEYEGYENNAKRLRENMDKNPVFAEMIVAARDADGFDPLVWMIEQKGLDLEALKEDPEYAKKLGEAREKHLQAMAAQADIDKQVETNMPKTIEAIKKKQQEMGLTDEQADEVVTQLYKVMDDLIVGVISPEQFEAQAKAMNYDKDVQAAHDEGVAQGLQTKVNDKLRSLETTPERSGGRQTPMQEPKPKKKVNNPFLADSYE